ncbi:MAG TPA: hypothetical protein VFJ98_09490, partial [Mycobacteriales bacterium]|nr:hypothetical protein [Mycobacteriales bacterium]
MPRHGGIVRNLLVLGSTVAVAAAGTGVANAEISFGNSEMVIIDSVKVSPPVLTTYSKCAAAVHNQMPVVPVTVVASFITSDGSEPVGPYGGLEDWSGGLVSAPDDHYGTDVGSNPTQFFHVTAKAAYPYWHGAGGYTFDAFAQDVGLAGGYAEVERGFSLPGLPPGGGGAVVKCPFAHPFSLGNVLSDMAKSGAEEALGAVCEACKAWYDGVKHVMYYNDLFNSVLKNSIVDDPPDANYQQIVTPQPAPVLAAPAGET